MRVNKYLPFAFIYFFINSVALPFGLTYTALLGPLFYVWMIIKRKKEILLPFLFILLPFILVHVFVVGVDQKSYFLSLLNIILVYLFCQAVYTFLKFCADPEKILRVILITNCILCLVAIIFYFTPWYDIFWIEQKVTTGTSSFRRLKLFTYEASYYATLFVPIFLFYMLQFFLKQNKIGNSTLLFMLFLPLVLSFSFGVIGVLLLAGLITFIIYFRQLAPKRRVVNAIITTGAFLGITLFLIALFFRHNIVFSRIINLISGQDTSGQGRTSDAFVIAGNLLDLKDPNWGIGFGQIKILGKDIIRDYYLYPENYPITIPNVTAETLAILGWIGLSLRLGIEVFFFFLTRVWRNYYRLLLFLFIFIYQFTGSFITSPAEYVIWIFAFTNVFKQFDVKIRKESLQSIAISGN
jgi:hypothetical protein